MKSVLLSLGFVMSAWGGQSPWDQTTIFQQLAGPISVRIKALHTISESKALLADPRVQRAVIRAQNESTNDPNWEALEETQEYEDYYDGALSSTLQKIATDYDNPEAWRALISSNYNEGSPFSKWLAEQPKALPFLFELARPPAKPWVRSHALYTLAEALGRCNAKQAEGACGSVKQHRREILKLIREALQEANLSISAILGLGLCGEAQDVALLSRAQSPDRGDLSDSENLRLFGKFIRGSQEQIESRLRKQ